MAPAGEPPAPRRSRLGAALPVALVIFGTASFLQQPLRAFDDGLYLTLARFTGPAHLPYADLWTLYGPGASAYASLVAAIGGPGVLAARIGLVLLQLTLVLGVYALASRFVARWIASGLACVVASFGYLHHHFHFTHTLALLVWGLWLVHVGATARPRRDGLVTAGCVLVGASYLGRYEFAPIGLVLAIVLWWAARPQVRGRALVALAMAVLPVVVFGIYLFSAVGLEVAWANLVDYPLHHYAVPGCRAAPTAWGPAWEALVAPASGRVWSGYELTLWIATFVTPVLAAGVALIAVLRRRDRIDAVILASIAGLTFLVWLAQRPRAGTEPHPAWAFTLISAAVLLGALGRSRPRWARGIGAATLAVFAAVVLTSWAGPQWSAWSMWPRHHPRYGFVTEEASGLFDETAWERIRAEVQSRVPPGAPIFVGLTDNSGHFANLAILYWLTDRPPGTRYIELDPCLTDRPAIQREIVRDLAATDLVILTPYFSRAAPGPPTEVLDAYLERHFVEVATAGLVEPGDVQILARAGSPAAMVAAPLGALDSARAPDERIAT